MRLIDANALLDLLRPLEGVSQIIKKILLIIRNCPTVDAVEVVHGKWLQDEPSTVYCSECSYRVYAHNNTPYCPNCGAKMNGGNEDG